MAKRHHAAKHHAMDGAYAGMESRRHQELEDANLIREDHSAVANLPQDVKYHDWRTGEGRYGMPEKLDDTDHGIEKQKDLDGSLMARHMVPKKV